MSPERWPPLRFETFETALRDGTPLLVRPIRPEDRELLRRGFERLSDRSRYRRFLSPIAELSDAQLVHLTEIDYENHFAWVAVRGDRQDEGVGVARYVRLSDEPDVAELAVTVVDAYQGRGVGTLLLALLAAAALSAGITAFRALALEENAPVRNILGQLGGRAERDSPGLLRIEVPLEPALLPDTPAGRVFREVAARFLTVDDGPGAQDRR